MSSETKWTPGPWKVEMTIYDHCACEVVGGRGIAPVWSGPRAWADATLMASAPDMASALASLTSGDVTYVGNEIRITCTSHGDAIRIMREARAALSKAGG